MSPVVMKFPSLQLWGLNQEKVKYMDSDVHILNNTLHALFLQNNGLMEEDRPLNGTSLLQTWRSYFSAKIVFEVFLSLTISWLKQAPFHTHTHQPEFWLTERCGGHCRRPNCQNHEAHPSQQGRPCVPGSLWAGRAHLFSQKLLSEVTPDRTDKASKQETHTFTV